MTETIYLHTCTNKCINSIFHEAMKKSLKIPKRRDQSRNSKDRQCHGNKWTKIQAIINIVEFFILTLASYKQMKKTVKRLELPFQKKLWEKHESA